MRQATSDPDSCFALKVGGDNRNDTGQSGPNGYRIRGFRIGLSFMVLFSFSLALFLATAIPEAHAQDIMKDIDFFGGIKDRSTGTPGSELAADYVLKSFENAGLSNVGTQNFLTPVPEVSSASLEVAGKKLEIFPWGPNLVYLPMTPRDGLRGPLIYVGDGNFNNFNGKPVRGSVVLMNMASYGNWTNAAMLGASALIFLGENDSISGDFQEKNTPTPLAFPRFWVSPEDGKSLRRLAANDSPEATVTARTGWQNKMVRNCYGFIQGKHPKLKHELVVLDAFYDSSSHVLGLAPGADEATSIVMLLSLARELAKDPPDRSVLFLATGGNAQSLAGMRHFIWSLAARKKTLRQRSKELHDKKQQVGYRLDLLKQNENLVSLRDPHDREVILQLLVEKAKDRADTLTREIQYQKILSRKEAPAGVEDPRPFRHLSWLTNLDDLIPEQTATAMQLLKEVIPDLSAENKELKLRNQAIKSSNDLRNMLDEYNAVLFLSLYLSSHSPYMGLVEMGETYPIRENVRRMVRAARLVHLLNQAGGEVADRIGIPRLIRGGSRGGSAEDSFGKSHGSSHPCCDVAVLAGLPAVSIMTLDDNRSRWSTPHDTLDHVDMGNLQVMSRFLPPLFAKLLSHPSLHLASEGGIPGLASLLGQAMFTRQGELFPDQPAPGTIISVMQKDTVFRAMVYRDGTFFIPGLANSRVALEKLILEPYGLDAETGRVVQTADKTATGKLNYRIRVKSDLANTSLVMFHCLQTDIVGVFNPQNLSYLTKAEVLDSATETTPLRHWFSRVDGRNTMAVSLFLEKGTRFKLIMAESLLAKEFLLLNSSPQSPAGKGFLIGDPLTIPVPPLQVVNDLHLLVGVRLRNLFQHGIVNHHLEALYETSGRELKQSEADLANNEYGDFWNNIVSAWAKLDGVYSEIERTQRDVLAGVMFFIALFVPFAYCVERYLFCFRGIYRQLLAFFIILMMTIVTIRALHPAFQLTYSPMVVILAFFIVGLSLLVSWIIFVRFEEEMAAIDSRASHVKTPQASKWQAFGAGFSIGVSNLNRRKLRTGLTCLTLIILTFTVMSFTNVKSLHKMTNTRIADEAPYEGILLRNQYGLPLSMLIMEDMKTRFGERASIWPRAWIDPTTPSDRTLALIFSSERRAPVEGILGLGHNPPEYFRALVTHGRWFHAGEENVVMLPVAMARVLGLNPSNDVNATVRIMGDPFQVVGYFDGARFESAKDLDQQSITPAYQEVTHGEELSEVEIEAIQSGEELLPQSQRFRYANANSTIIFPIKKCLVYGGKLKAIVILPRSGQNPASPYAPGPTPVMDMADQLSGWLALPLFVGENGLWYHSASTTLRYQGVANLIVPILIVIFITLNTMIGHVHERQREIATYTSIGLAPTHVGFLFIVEALSLAVISTVIGYILAQLSAKFLGGTPLFSQLTFNYSSLASVACMFLVFSVVFLAALYPAKLAAEIAMPDVDRSWRLPEPEGDSIFMNLPFLFRYEEEKGIIGFLNAFYVSHHDVAHGSFIADETLMNLEVPEMRPAHVPAPLCILIRTNIWLMPFDFGIKQRIQLHCCPSTDNPGYLEIAIQLIRLSGERSAWIRANKNFIRALRKQLLLWRFLDTSAKVHFKQLVPLAYAGQMEEPVL